jgi:hypothetical protein
MVRKFKYSILVICLCFLISTISATAPVMNFTATTTSGGQAQLTTGCDFSKQPGIERCFGGIGPQCDGIPVLAPITKDEKTCIAKGSMSIGSILHDKCCLKNKNSGVMCEIDIPHLFSQTCINEWKEAQANTFGDRQWDVEFGPYYSGNGGDDTTKELTAPSGARVNPEYLGLCQSRKCLEDKNGNTIIQLDGSGWYCTCE